MVLIIKARIFEALQINTADSLLLSFLPLDKFCKFCSADPPLFLRKSVTQVSEENAMRATMKTDLCAAAPLPLDVLLTESCLVDL